MKSCAIYNKPLWTSSSRRAPLAGSRQSRRRRKARLSTTRHTSLVACASALGDAPPAKSLIEHEDRVIQAAALAMGVERIQSFAQAWAADGDSFGAAKLCWIGHLLMARGVISRSVHDDLIFRAVSLLEACSSEDTRDFEIYVLNKAWSTDIGSDRHSAANVRLKEMTAGVKTYEAILGEALIACTDGWTLQAVWGERQVYRIRRGRIATRCSRNSFSATSWKWRQASSGLTAQENFRTWLLSLPRLADHLFS